MFNGSFVTDVSAGAVGFKNSRKSTSLAAEVGASTILEKSGNCRVSNTKGKDEGDWGPCFTCITQNYE
jgi:hypothetical protein